MPLPPPFPDPSHIETRLLIVSQMLENAVVEVRRVMAQIKGELDVGDEPEPPRDASNESERTDE